ncbi:MAG: hypothetical protein ABSD69_02775 [Candidatus Levyibacteriota bacterium]|jgi:hypothetical protein
MLEKEEDGFDFDQASAGFTEAESVLRSVPVIGLVDEKPREKWTQSKMAIFDIQIAELALSPKDLTFDEIVERSGSDRATVSKSLFGMVMQSRKVERRPGKKKRQFRF